ncbi:MAG: SDR family NAD(P)-dependent oxidoreductase [Armatimonadota bacterium]|nr:MAG: SDR family NAD(P)-dependent oxidoreductase [Armatimonadota bacterium]
MTDWTGRRVLVTGAGGFIGSHLATELVERGARVTAMLHYHARPARGNLEFFPSEAVDQMEVVRGDVRDSHFMLRAVEDVEVVFHLAALIAIPYSYVAPGAYVTTNVIGTLNVLEACRANRTPRLVHTSTSECYGTARYTPINEEHPLQGQSPYSATKIGADKLVESYCRSFDLPAATLRPFNAFGPGQSARAVIPTILSQLIAGRPELRLGSLEPIRDMSYVANAVDAFLQIADCDEAIGETVNAGSGEGRTIQEIAEAAMEVVGRRVPVVLDPQRVRPDESEVLELICDNGKAERLMGWRPTVGFTEGLKLTASFVEAHPEIYRPEEYAL